MQTLSELEEAVLGRLVKTRHEGALSRYEALVRSAVQMGAEAIDGFMMMDVEKMIGESLAGLPESVLRSLWQEAAEEQATEADPAAAPVEESMRHDIRLAALQRVANTVCAEARTRLEERRKRR